MKSSRRAFLVHGASFGAAALVVACSPGSPASPTDVPATRQSAAPAPTAQPTGPPASTTVLKPTVAPTAATRATVAAKKISIWTPHTDKESVSSTGLYLIDPFNKANPTVDVELVPIADYERVLDTAVAAGKVADIFLQNGPAWIAPYADAGYAAELDDYAKDFGWAQKYWPWIWEQGRYKGKVYLVGHEFEMLNLFYNKPEFDQNGWKVPNNWNELLALGKEIQAKKKMVYAVGKDTGVYEWWLCYIAHAWAGSHAVWEGLAGKRKWSEPLFVEAYQKSAELWQSGFLSDKQAMSLSVSDARGLFAQGRAMLLLEGTWTMRSIGSWAQSLQWDAAPAPMWNPTVRKALAIGAGEISVINAKGPNRDDAAKVEDAFFFGSKDSILSFADKPGMPGTVLPPMFYEDKDFPPTFNPMYKKQILDMVAAAKSNDYGFLAWCSWPQKTEAYMYNNLAAVWLGQTSAQEYLNHTQAVFEEDQKAGVVIPGPEPRQ